MNYIFNGNLKGFYCEECYDYLHKANIKIYAIDKENGMTAFVGGREKELIHQQGEDELRLLSKRLLSETETDESGNFTVNLSGTENYNGGTLEIDFDCGSVPVYFGIRTFQKPPKAVKFHIAALQPLWKEIPHQRHTLSAYWEYGISNKFCW